MILALIVAVVAVLELVMAFTTLGTDDVRRWSEFAAEVGRVGPVDVYATSFESVYNHPPLVGYLLLAVDGSTDDLEGLAFEIRLPAILAGALLPFVLFGLLDRRVTTRRALAAAAAVALSPALLAISGFHGNTDSVVITLALAAVYLLIDRRAPVWAGVAIAGAIGVKLVPVVVVPTLLVAAWRSGRRDGVRFTVAAAVTTIAVWGPAFLAHPGRLIENVLGYAGGVQGWGLVQLGDLIASDGPHVWGDGAARFLVVAVVAIGPAWMTWRSPVVAPAAVAVALTGLLLLATGFGMQYLAWAIAPAYLLTFGLAMAFNVTASVLAWLVYTRWSGGLPWFVANSSPFTGWEIAVSLLAWFVLAAITVVGVRTCLRAGVGEGAASPVGSRS